MSVVSFPIFVISVHLTRFFAKKSNWQFFATGLVASEAVFEAAPQLILKTYIILSHFEREVDVSQIVSILTSIITISKSSIELFLSETWIPERGYQGSLPQTNDDSMQW